MPVNPSLPVTPRPGAETYVTIKVPISNTGFPVVRRVDTSLDPHQYLALRQIFDGLQADHAELADGHYVDRPGQVVRWLLEQVSKALGERA